MAQLHTNDDEVILQDITQGHLDQLSPYEGWAKLTSEVETSDRLVLEPGETASYSYPDFYEHSHFNEDKFYNRGSVPTDSEDAAARQNRVDRIVKRLKESDGESI